MKTSTSTASGIQPWHLALFVGGALLILVASFGFLGTAKGWFVEHMPLRFYADSALQLRPGLPVRMAGIKVGQVDTISLDDSGKVLVKIIVERRYASFLHQDTKATLAKENLMGDSFVDLSVGSKDSASLADNDVIAYVPATDINAVAKQMADKLDATMTELQHLLKTLNDPKGKLANSMAHMDALLIDMQKTRANLDRTLNAVDTAARDANMKATLEHANQVITHANETLENMESHWPFTPSDELQKAREEQQHKK